MAEVGTDQEAVGVGLEKGGGVVAFGYALVPGVDAMKPAEPVSPSGIEDEAILDEEAYCLACSDE